MRFRREREFFHFIEQSCRFCCFSDGGYKFDDDSYWNSDADIEFQYGQMDINNINGLGQGFDLAGNPGLVVDPGRLDINVGR